MSVSTLCKRPLPIAVGHDKVDQQVKLSLNNLRKDHVIAIIYSTDL